MTCKEAAPGRCGGADRVAGRPWDWPSCPHRQPPADGSSSSSTKCGRRSRPTRKERAAQRQAVRQHRAFNENASIPACGWYERRRSPATPPYVRGTRPRMEIGGGEFCAFRIEFGPLELVRRGRGSSRSDRLLSALCTSARSAPPRPGRWPSYHAIAARSSSSASSSTRTGLVTCGEGPRQCGNALLASFVLSSCRHPELRIGARSPPPMPLPHRPDSRCFPRRDWQSAEWRSQLCPFLEVSRHLGVHSLRLKPRTDRTSKSLNSQAARRTRRSRPARKGSAAQRQNVRLDGQGAWNGADEHAGAGGSELVHSSRDRKRTPTLWRDGVGVPFFHFAHASMILR